jgi:hypothetical protein
MRTYVLTPDGKVTQLLDVKPLRVDEVEACKRVCVKFDAADVLPMLGVTA